MLFLSKRKQVQYEGKKSTSWFNHDSFHLEACAYHIVCTLKKLCQLQVWDSIWNTNAWEISSAVAHPQIPLLPHKKETENTESTLSRSVFFWRIWSDEPTRAMLWNSWEEDNTGILIIPLCHFECNPQWFTWKARLMCFHVTQTPEAERVDDSFFNNTGFGVLNTEKPCGWERAFLGAPRRPSPYWLVYERNPESALWPFSLTRLTLPWVMSAIKAISNIYYYTVVTSPWTSPRRICDSVLLKQM